MGSFTEAEADLQKVKQAKYLKVGLTVISGEFTDRLERHIRLYTTYICILLTRSEKFYFA